MYFQELDQKYLANRWYFLVAGIGLIIFGFYILLAPEMPEALLVIAFGVYQIIDASVLLLPVILGRTTQHLWKVTVTKGVAELIIGILAITHVSLFIEIFVVVVGLLLVVRGILELVTLVETHAHVTHQRLILVTALIAIIVGTAMILHPLRGDTTFSFIVGVYAIVKGAALLVSSARIARAIDSAFAESSLLAYLHSEVPLVDEIADGVGKADEDAEQYPDFTRTTRGGLLTLDTSKYQRPMVVAPHPDDLEGFAAGLVTLTDGPGVSVVMAGGNLGVWSKEFEDMPEQDYIHVRLEESAEAGRILGIEQIAYMGYKDRGVIFDEGAVQKVLHQLQHFEPDLVISFEYHKWLNPYRHPDHLATANVVREAIKRYEHKEHIDYLVTSTFAPNRFIDVTGVRRLKLQALACHTTQATLNAAIFPFLEKLITRVWGILYGTNFAEGYREVDVRKL